MEIAEVIKTLRNLRRKWRREITREHKFQKNLQEKYEGNYVPSSYEKSVGIDIGYSICASDIDKLIKKLERQAEGVLLNGK